MLVVGATDKTDLYKAEGNNIVIVNEEFIEDDDVDILSKDDLKDKRLQIEFYKYIRNENTEEMEKEYLYRGDVDHFDRSCVEGLNHLSILEYYDSNKFTFEDQVDDTDIYCDIHNIGYFIFNVLTDNYENINLNDYKFLKDFDMIFDYLDYNDYKNTWQVKDLNPNDFEGNLDDLNIVPYDFYMDTTLPDGDGGLIFTKEQVDELDNLLADYLKNKATSTGKTRKLEL